ncbi:MAG: glycosyltransferase family 2 protein, partial [Bryobacteraceae bacterium]
MRPPRVTVAIPTLDAGAALLACIQALERQTLEDIEAVVVDNSGRRLARPVLDGRPAAVIDNDRNAGFGAAVNQVLARSRAPYLAALNDDAVPAPTWLAELVAAMEAEPEAGMCASQVRLAGEGCLDSAGMLICADGSSKQRGHREPPDRFSLAEEVLLPSASAALYRRAMLDQIGGFDEDFFLYCEDTDLGLRARWAGWKCLYVPAAVVDHSYSRTAGAASPLKAYFVERNRLFVLVKNFPARLLLVAPLVTLARYFWHLADLAAGRGAAARYAEQGSPLGLVWLVVRAQVGLARIHARLWTLRRRIRRSV